jgi:cell division transport system ATP-binding protein
MIKFSSVSKYFPPDAHAIKDISFEIEPGELVLLTGPSGSGKTTIMKLLTKEYLASEGDIFFSDQNLNEIKDSQVHEHKRKIGVIFQDYKLLPELNIWENIALPLSIVGKNQEEIEQRVTDLLTLVSLTEKAFLFPKQLSGGEAQRISIARALSTGPGIVFADEPTGNLDRDTSLEIGKLIQKINSLGTTIVFATHDHDVMELLKEARHINLEKGKLVGDSKKPSKEKKEVVEKDMPENKLETTKEEVKKPTRKKKVKTKAKSKKK